MTAVAIVKGTDPSRMVTRALRLIGADTLVTPDDRVLVKPNYVSAKPPSTSTNRSPRPGPSKLSASAPSGTLKVSVT